MPSKKKTIRSGRAGQPLPVRIADTPQGEEAEAIDVDVTANALVQAMFRQADQKLAEKLGDYQTERLDAPSS